MTIGEEGRRQEGLTDVCTDDHRCHGASGGSGGHRGGGGGGSEYEPEEHCRGFMKAGKQ